MQAEESGWDDQRSSTTWKEITSAVGTGSMTVQVHKWGYSKKDNCDQDFSSYLLSRKRFSVKNQTTEQQRTFLTLIFHPWLIR